MSPPIKGALIMVGAALSFSVMGMLVKVASPEVPTMEAIFFRGLVGLPIVVIAARRRGVRLRGNRRWLLAGRGVFGSIGLVMFFYALGRIPVADSLLLNQATAIFVLPLAAIFLRERITALHIALVLLALGGAILVIRPGGDVTNVAGFVGLGSALFAGMAYVLIRKLTATESTLTIVFWFICTATLVSLPLALPVWVTPSPRMLGVLFAMGLAGTAGQLLTTTAYSYGEAGRLAVLGSLGAVFGAGWDVLLWSHVPPPLTVVGALTVIFACAAVQLLRQHPARDTPLATPPPT